MNTLSLNSNPWSGLGAKIDLNDTLEVALKKAELDWEAKRAPECFIADGEVVVGPDSILYRSDNNFKLGNVTKTYHIVQPHEIIQSYKDLASLKGWPIEYMGVIDGGVRIWALAKTDRVFGEGDSKMTTYLLLTTTYDGSSGTIGKFINLCSDLSSISLAVADNVSYARFSVNHKTVFDAKKLSQKLNLIDKASTNFEQYIETLSKKKLNESSVVKFLVRQLEGSDIPIEDISSRQSNIILKLLENWRSHTDISAKGTALGLVKTIAQDVDYNVGRNVNNRMRAAWFGLGEKRKVDSFNSLLKLPKTA